MVGTKPMVLPWALIVLDHCLISFLSVIINGSFIIHLKTHNWDLRFRAVGFCNSCCSQLYVRIICGKIAIGRVQLFKDPSFETKRGIMERGN